MTIGGRSATNVTFISSTSLTATAPSQTGSGNYDVVVTNPDTQTGTCSGCMRYTIEGSSFFTPSGTFAINQGATCTPIPDVTLTLTAEKATDVVIANNQDPSMDGPWQLINLNQLTPTTTTIPWTLPASEGTHTVHLRYRSVHNIASQVMMRAVTLDQATSCGQGSSPISTSPQGSSGTPAPTSGVSLSPSPTPAPAVTPSLHRDLAREREALKTFTRLFRRLPSSPEDWQALHHLAYGNAIPRNLAQERAGLTRFVRIFRRLPHATNDWRAVHVLAYPALSTS